MTSQKVEQVIALDRALRQQTVVALPSEEPRSGSDDLEKELQEYRCALGDDADSIKMWTGLKSFDVVRAMRRQDAPDPRVGLRERCMFYGAATRETPTHEVLSFCYPSKNDTCYYKACFHVGELARYLQGFRHPKTRCLSNVIPNPFYDEMSRDMKDLVVHRHLPRGLVLLVLHVHKVVKRTKQSPSAPPLVNDPLERYVTQNISKYAEKHPERLSWFGWIKNVTWATASRMYQWITTNKFMGAILFIVTLCIRIIVCVVVRKKSLSTMTCSMILGVLKMKTMGAVPSMMLDKLMDLFCHLFACVTDMTIFPSGLGECVSLMLKSTGLKKMTANLAMYNQFYLVDIVKYVLFTSLESFDRILVLSYGFVGWNVDKSFVGSFVSYVRSIIGKGDAIMSIVKNEHPSLVSEIKKNFGWYFCLYGWVMIPVYYLPFLERLLQRVDPEIAEAFAQLGQMMNPKAETLGDALLPLIDKGVMITRNIVLLAHSVSSLYRFFKCVWQTEESTVVSEMAPKEDCCFTEVFGTYFKAVQDITTSNTKYMSSGIDTSYTRAVSKPVLVLPGGGTRRIRVYLCRWKLVDCQRQTHKDLTDCFYQILPHHVARDFPQVRMPDGTIDLRRLPHWRHVHRILLVLNRPRACAC